MADYGFYKISFFGNQIDENNFPRLSAKAQEYLAFLERDYTVTGEEQERNKAICALAEAIQSTEKAASAALAGVSGGAVASKSIGSVSVSYRNVGAADVGMDLSERATQRRYYDIARRYLTIYRGVR